MSLTIHDDTNHSELAKNDLDPPLRLAILAGRQELVLKFTEMNQFGLPRAVDTGRIEVGLGRLSFHIYPHQVRYYLGRLMLTTTMIGTQYTYSVLSLCRLNLHRSSRAGSRGTS